MNEEDNEEVRTAGTSEAKSEEERAREDNDELREAIVEELAAYLRVFYEADVAAAVRKAFPGSNIWRWGEAREAFPEEARRISYYSEAVAEEEARATQEDHQRSEAGGS